MSWKSLWWLVAGIVVSGIGYYGVFGLGQWWWIVGCMLGGAFKGHSLAVAYQEGRESRPRHEAFQRTLRGL